ncbi:MAG TPA: HAD family hydrolase [Chthoniobacterales bacterium]
MGKHSLGQLPSAGKTSKRAVFLDRDGVINFPLIRDRKPYPPRTLSEFQLMPGVESGCRRLKEAGFVLIVATNQPDVGRGELPREAVEEIHRSMEEMLPIDRTEVCYDSGREGDCSDRKPAPGMLLRAAGDLGIDLPSSFMIGDRWRDVDCGAAAGCRTIFIDYGYDERLKTSPDFRVQNFEEAVEIILSYTSLSTPC